MHDNDTNDPKARSQSSPFSPNQINNWIKLKLKRGRKRTGGKRLILFILFNSEFDRYHFDGKIYLTDD